jgi:hypothetical protein
MDPDEVARTCDELHECFDQGPGENYEASGRALSALSKLREAASWDYPVSILMELEVQLARWFSPKKWRGSDDGLRENLLDHISRLEDAWDRPRA